MAPPSPEKPALYATSAACAAAGLFRRRECDAAFANTMAELRTRGLASPSKIDCILRFHLCERTGRDGLFTPVALGVEITRTGAAIYATPVLAVATPQGLLQPRPIVDPPSPTPPRETAVIAQPPRNALPTDHFERIDPRSVREAWRHFAPSALDATPASFVPQTVAELPQRESRQARRARLQAAPFVE